MMSKTRETWEVKTNEIKKERKRKKSGRNFFTRVWINKERKKESWWRRESDGEEKRSRKKGDGQK